jgi:uncharacterized repeat protein (TIGR01451 family)
LSLLEQREIIVSVLNAIPPTLNANDTLHLAAQIFPMENDSFVQDNYASLNQVVVNSVDPNDKIETHGGTIPYSAVQNREYLYYTIRFQNTGNSYATRIVITDTLTENVDASTLEFLSSSVPFVMNVVDRKHITWTAANTYLPDSIADEANSHGYISFRIKPKAGLLPSDEITNRASIVFDYNAAILTNTCTTNIIEQRILSVKNNEIKSIHLFPNPTNGNVQLNMNLLQNKNYTLRIIDINGNLLSNENLKGNAGENNVSIDLSTLRKRLVFYTTCRRNWKFILWKSSEAIKIDFMKNFKLIAFIIFCAISIKTKAQLFTWNKTVDTITSFSENIYGIFTKIKETTGKHIIYVQNKHQISNQFGNLKYDSVIISKYTFDGNIVWKKKYQLTSGGSINDFIETPDKGFLLIGEIGLNNSVVKLDSNGNVVFIRNYLNTDSLMKLDQIVATNDGNYIVTSTKDIQEDVCLWPTVYYMKHSTFITKINALGNIVWQRFLNESKFRISSINYPFINTESNLGVKFDFYDTINNDFNIIFQSKNNYSQPPIYLNLLHFDKDGNKLDSTIISEFPINYDGWTCAADGQNIVIKPTENGYTYFNTRTDTSLLIEYHYNKQGILTDSINRYLSNQYPYRFIFTLKVLIFQFLVNIIII